MNLQNKEVSNEFNKFKDLYLFLENKKFGQNQKLNDFENKINNKNLIILQLQESLKVFQLKILRMKMI